MPIKEQTDKDRPSALEEYGKNPCDSFSTQQRRPTEHPRRRGSSAKNLFGSGSSGKGCDEDNVSRATSLDRSKQQHSQGSSSSQALGHAMGKYLNQALQEEPWNPVVTREQTDKVFGKKQPDEHARGAEAGKQQGR